MCCRSRNAKNLAYRPQCRKIGKENSAFSKGEEHCLKCGFCCEKPCVPSPDELKIIAKYLKMDVREAIDTFFVIDRTNEFYYLRPLKTNGLEHPGKYMPCCHFETEKYEGNCVFLNEDNLCTIYQVRPEEARMMGCWLKRPDTYDSRDSWEPNLLWDVFGIDGFDMELNGVHLWPEQEPNLGDNNGKGT